MKGAGRGKRGGRKPPRSEPDDRPRGYEAQRMHQLWRDIDHAKHKAGLGAASEQSPTSSWCLADLIGRATALAGDAAAWVTASAPAACTLVASGAAILRDVPLVGRIVALVPSFGTTAATPRAEGVGAHAVRSTDNGAHPARRGGEPNGEWIH
jgi:hypothetical protein